MHEMANVSKVMLKTKKSLYLYNYLVLWLCFAGQNQIRYIPESFGDLQSLKVCSLPKNRLVELPDSLGNLLNLEKLFLEYNHVRKLLY